MDNYLESVEKLVFGKYLNPQPFGITSFGQIAQLVEQRTENPCVGGSIPPRATTYAAVAQLVRAPGCGSGGR